MVHRRLFSGLVAVLALGCASCSRDPAGAGVRCGNGRIDPGEACDEGRANDDAFPGACRTDCTPSRCGDGVIDPGEGCDDGPENGGEGPGACRETCVPAVCGDGVRDEGEECDDGPYNDDEVPGACRTTCRAASCGDGVRDLGEECDDGPANDDAGVDTCRTTCRRPHCGDGVLAEGEACDGGAANSDTAADACRTSCQLPSCGDGAIDTGEACDDGDRNADDVPDACRLGCRLPTCGDGVIDLGEECDDSDPLGVDGCTRQCALNLPATCFEAGVPVLDLRAVGVPDGAGYRVEADFESGPGMADLSCQLPGHEVLYAMPIPVAGDLVVELEMPASQTTRGGLGVWRSCEAPYLACLGDGGWTGRIDFVERDVSPAQGTYFFLVDQMGQGRTHYTLRAYVRPALGVGETCAVDGSTGRCEAVGQPFACVDPDGDGWGTCVERLPGGAACDPAGVELCLEPLSCRNGVCGPSCGDGTRQAWEACDDGNLDDGDNCSSVCQPRMWTCADPFDLNLAWDPEVRRAEWVDDIRRSENHLSGVCATARGPDLVATFAAPAAGRYHFQAAAKEDEPWSPALVLLQSCDPVSSLACPQGGVESTVRLAAGERVFVAVDRGDRDHDWGWFSMTVAAQICGDGVIQGDEECDDGNARADDACLPDCTLPGESCAAPHRLPPPDATGRSEWAGSWADFVKDLPEPSCGSGDRDAVTTFTAPSAGRYAFQVIEGADYVAVRSGSCSGGAELGCSDYPDGWAVEADLAAGQTVWVAVAVASSEAEAFRVEVLPVRCGDGIRVRSEGCDDGNSSAGDGCDATCRAETVPEIEPNDLRVQAQLVPVGTSVAGSLTPRERDFFAIDLEAGASYTLTTYVPSFGSCSVPAGTGRPTLDLYSPSTAPVAQATACTPLVYVAPTTGRYTVRLEQGGLGVPAYVFDIRRP